MAEVMNSRTKNHSIKANEAFVAEDYSSAIVLYTDAINEDDSCADYYSNRAQAYIKLNNHIAAKSDAQRALHLNPDCGKSCLRLGIACFNLNEFEEAKIAFEKSLKYNESDSTLKTWIRKCDAELNLQQQPEGHTPSVGISNNMITSNEEPCPIILPQKTKFDWYQTDTLVYINILLKSLKKQDVLVNFTDTTLSLTAKQPNGSDYSLELDLAHPIMASQSTFRVIPSKIEIKMKKAEGIRWSSLENDGSQPTPIKQFMQDTSTSSENPLKYPSSRKQVPNWDKMAQEVQQEEESTKLEGDAALNQLFQKIYRDGSDEVKRAMNKSFMESGGTVLSTNWKEVVDKKIEVKPPDGLEFKKWDS